MVKHELSSPDFHRQPQPVPRNSFLGCPLLSSVTAAVRHQFEACLFLSFPS